ncbi:hypothetical protein F8M41_021347 [Gigaspora margarita]|uniref:Uncharacterized protein n=1 Tax=Gigaspora margarita TaxID=4874 RepID=A0A8H4EU09_GIGMA|nr:hypothetical protein F8M41_021347 [Gigaspora margarita]
MIHSLSKLETDEYIVIICHAIILFALIIQSSPEATCCWWLVVLSSFMLSQPNTTYIVFTYLLVVISGFSFCWASGQLFQEEGAWYFLLFIFSEVFSFLPSQNSTRSILLYPKFYQKYPLASRIPPEVFFYFFIYHNSAHF